MTVNLRGSYLPSNASFVEENVIPIAKLLWDVESELVAVLEEVPPGLAEVTGGVRGPRWGDRTRGSIGFEIRPSQALPDSLQRVVDRERPC